MADLNWPKRPLVCSKRKPVVKSYIFNKKPKFFACGGPLRVRAARLSDVLTAACARAGLRASFPVLGTLVGMYFGAGPVPWNFDMAKTTDERLYAAFFHAMLAEGVALAPGAYEALFVGVGHTDDVIDTELLEELLWRHCPEPPCCPFPIASAPLVIPAEVFRIELIIWAASRRYGRWCWSLRRLFGWGPDVFGEVRNGGSQSEIAVGN